MICIIIVCVMLKKGKYMINKGSRKKSYFFNGPATKALQPPTSSLVATFIGGINCF